MAANDESTSAGTALYIFPGISYSIDLIPFSPRQRRDKILLANSCGWRQNQGNNHHQEMVFSCWIIQEALAQQLSKRERESHIYTEGQKRRVTELDDCERSRLITRMALDEGTPSLVAYGNDLFVLRLY